MYDVRRLDLNVVHTDPVQLVQPGKRIAEVFCLQMDAGTSFRIRFGTGDFFTIPAAFSFEPTDEETNNSGLYWDNPTSQNSIVEVVIVYQSSGSGLNPMLP